ncbi:1-(5-phosphoribosyl)-5-[(5-phosphoribosylamino)methylideneamino] imidazole-4-carboxamide isomerase [Buchnera aphidicola]|uniref:1-(5-phosphoribosyl)-5-[(5-phosphoribosylamino)methylideneamino] imidazole-4-carboxamide isomerase n=1 Tax=Buchnera aphidicola (Stegophylla sp.) TaxID=2315800 RepID=A0A4D6YAZ3_9GAMM|nr:1-(5-phosphoribosyl)-5-[(5-phosphoribosylamino)methylideneamino] imidazole-4-carboxamide isomerase [Buchnera aphidicola (Stegophylla sp.)]QCI26262.1 1-(5-phosphoribosyl)-5-[(5-phosphoribosylamino)methylideneamino] imidazole-4-carboxamide isomerase [Buchnera aphidicola (Stegophylla sp.)]
MIIPALDILNDKIVRLYQGNYNLLQYYNYKLSNLLKYYVSLGINIIHIVDLDGANNPKNRQKKTFLKIINKFKNYIQIGGGIRNIHDIEYFSSLGVQRIVIGSAIIDKIHEIRKWIDLYGNDFIVAALDVRIMKNNKKIIFTNGWKKNTHIELESILKKLLSFNIKHVLCTDISCDGTLLGPNLNLYQEIVDKFPCIHFQASGGISTIDDITRLKNTKVDNIIIGRSLLEKRFTIVEAMQCWQNELSHV